MQKIQLLVRPLGLHRHRQIQQFAALGALLPSRSSSSGAYATATLKVNKRLTSSTAIPLPSTSTAQAKGTPLAIWFEGVFPVKLSRWDPRHTYARVYANQLKEDAKKIMIPPPEEFPKAFTYLNSVSSIKEGGLLVRFLYDGDKKEAFDTIEKYVEGKGGMRSLLTLGTKLKAHPVEGVPWIEDLRSSIPSSRINLTFKGPELPIEQLYNEFRGFGKIDSVVVQPGAAKDSPKVGHIQFLSSRAATSARVCMNGKVIDGTTILVSYEPALPRNAIFNFIRDHPRISFPIVLAILAFLSFLIFDPMRVFFVTNTITERFSIQKYSLRLHDVVEFIKESVLNLAYGELPKNEQKEDDTTVSDALMERKEHEAKLMMYLKETPETAMLIHGPKGTRSGDLIEKCTKNEPYVLRINLDELINQPDHIMLNRLASQIGCFPMFNWTVSSGAVLDTLVTAGTGVKAGFSSTSDSQVRKIFEIATIAINSITAAQVSKHQAAVDQHHHVTNGHASLNDIADADTVLASIPEIQYPIVIIDGFLSNEKAKQSFVYELAAEWAASLTELHIAQVVFMSDNPASIKFLGRAIPSRTVDTITLADASYASSIAYAYRRLGLPTTQKLPTELEECIKALGGRLSDLEQLMQKTKAALKAQRHRAVAAGNDVSLIRKLRLNRHGEHVVDLSDAASATPEELANAVKKAFNDIVVRTETEIRKVGLFEDVGVSVVAANDGKKEWNAVQVWKIIQLLTKYDEVSYDDLRYHPLFKGDESAIQAIERAGLITVGLQEGRPYIIKAGRPVYKSAFTRLQNDKKYAAIMGLKTVKVLVNDEMAKVSAYEKELALLTTQVSADRISFFSDNLSGRVNFLAKLISECHTKLYAYDAEERRLKKIVKLSE
ncbi:UNVERIFIED_CONTAM: mitochondrial escape protein 2 [Siphonaria sp. JEL0065]|nr:mitochondrial escape protein 2 [Siphonaria sp. JEL0065]